MGSERVSMELPKETAAAWRDIGDGLPSGRGTISTRLSHQIKDRTAVLPFFAFFDQPGPRGLLLHVIPSLPIIFLGPQIPIKILRLPDRWRNVQRGSELAGADALPHLHPVRHRPRNRCTTCKEMDVIGHENVMTKPTSRRVLPIAPIRRVEWRGFVHKLRAFVAYACRL
jgi:hypothetical protein